MIVNPNHVSQFDAEWKRARAFLQVLPLTTRTITVRQGNSRVTNFRSSASEYLVRPEYYDAEQHKTVVAPYYVYDLEFSGISLRISGTIPVDHYSEIAEFKRVVSEALNSPYTRINTLADSIESENFTHRRVDLQERVAEVDKLKKFASSAFSEAVLEVLLSPGRRYIKCVAEAAFGVLFEAGLSQLEPKRLN